MDKKLRKKIETQLVMTMEGVLSRIHSGAFSDSKKKIKEAGKMVAKKFAKSVAAFEKEKAKPAKKAAKKITKKKSPAGKQQRDSHGRFRPKKK